MIRRLEEPTRYRFSRDEYHHMGDAGILPPDRRVELLDGEIVEMSPIGIKHRQIVVLLSEMFQQGLPADTHCQVQQPIVLGDESEPEPDLAIIRGRPTDYMKSHPTADAVILLIEVAQASVKFDLGDKLRAYARAGISEYWVIDVAAKSLIVHREPQGDSYGAVTAHASDAVVVANSFPKLTIDLAALPLA